ncbi:MAG: trypsin-like peptidase domain-containing protein, partial [Candidatus Peregrinibacteria bacterium]
LQKIANAVRIDLRISSGSGTVISQDGLVLTNNHVIFDEVKQRPLDAFEVCVTFEMEKEPLCQYTAKLVAYDKELDLAILKMNPTDVFGEALPALKTIDYSQPATPKEEHMVQVIGYPASGGETITINKGQISGFDTFNGYKYFKTDTDFDHGSSGGTVLDENGNFIGVPTYIRSYAENVGYFLDLRQALPWIQENLNHEPAENAIQEAQLIKEMARFMEANKTLAYQTTQYPYFKITLGEDWHFFRMDEDHFFAGQKNVQDGVGVNIQVERYPFAIDEGYLAKLDEEFIRTRDRFPDFKKEAVKFAGYDGTRITYTSYNQRNTIFYIPYGYALVGISYAINLDKEENQTKALTPVLNSIEFTSPPEEEPNLTESIEYQTPAFRIRTADDFRIQKPLGSNAGDELVHGTQAGNYEGEFNVYYSFVPKDARQLSGQEKLEEETKSLAQQDLKLVYKKDDVVMDGLKGYLYTFEYEGDLYQQARKRLVMKLDRGEYEFSIEYDDLSGTFDANLPTLRKILNSFEYLGEAGEGKGQREFGALGQIFTDIQHHRFATAISELADKGIVEGYEDKRFHPELFARQADALKAILESKNKLEKERGLGNEVNFDDFQTHGRNPQWFDGYLAYAMENGVLEPEEFSPYVGITLGQALKWLTAAYEMPVWEGQTRTPYKRYMDKGYELGLIPQGMGDEDTKLTRAELCHLVSTVYNQAK